MEGRDYGWNDRIWLGINKHLEDTFKNQIESQGDAYRCGLAWGETSHLSRFVGTRLEFLLEFLFQFSGHCSIRYLKYVSPLTAFASLVAVDDKLPTFNRFQIFCLNQSKNNVGN